MKKPTIHSNGSSLESLMDQNDQARAAVRKAIEALEAAAPHERDYYQQGPRSFSIAKLEHQLRIDKLMQVQTDLEELRQHLSDEEDLRSTSKG